MGFKIPGRKIRNLAFYLADPVTEDPSINYTKETDRF